MNDFLEQEAMIDGFVAQGDSNAAVKALFDLIVHHAKKKEFSKAEALRERLFQVDAMALTEIVRSGEIIEEEKTEQRDQRHLETWKALYDKLSAEQANALYYALTQVTFNAGERVFSQGERNSNLYFIDEGEIKITITSKGAERLVMTLNPGETLGQETFFSKTAHCTTEASALSRSKVNYLEKGTLKNWSQAFPTLESTLHDFCHRMQKIEDSLRKKDLERRTQERIRIGGKLLVQLLGSNGKAMGKPFKGGFQDISEGGLSFSVRILNRDTAHLLLGRNLILNFVLPFGDSKKGIERRGRVIGAEAQAFGDYFFHIKFQKPLPADIVEPLANRAGSELGDQPKLALSLEG
jgi:CRP-like cAMP-binding protein